MKKTLLCIFIFTCFMNMASANYVGAFKLSTGMFKYNSNELTGSSTTIGSPGIGILKNLDDRHQFGLGLDIFFSFATQSVSLYSVGLLYRYSFTGRSTSVINETPDVTITSNTKGNFYLLGAFKRYTYFLGSNKSEEIRFDQNGDFFNLDLGPGYAYDIGDRLRLTAELSSTIIAFSSSDDRIRFTSILLAFGIQKEF
jgi:hypothetical protein